MPSGDQEDADLRDVLSEIFCERVHLDLLEKKQLDRACVFLIRMKYDRRSDSGNSKRIVQTAVVLSDNELDVPQFALWPRTRGVVGMLVGRLSGMGNITFDDSGVFSDAYLLHGWNEQAVRLLFTHGLQEFLADHPGWSARGKGHHLVVFKHNRDYQALELTQFMQQALEVLTQFQKGEERLDDHANVRRETTVEDVRLAANKMGGIQGHFIQSELRKCYVTENEIDEFLGQSVPRTNPPTGLRYQVGGNNGLLVFLGAMLLVAGVASPVCVALFGTQDDLIIAIVLGLAFLLTGSVIFTLALRHRIRRKRLLHSGTVVQGVVKKVERANVQINNAQRYHLHLAFELDGHSRSVVSNIYSNIEEARRLAATTEQVRILVDPKDQKHLLCVDTLLISQ